MPEPYSSTQPADPRTAFFDQILLSDFDQFNPSLGTLERIEVYVEIDAFWELDGSGSSVNDDQSLNSFDFEAGFADGNTDLTFGELLVSATDFVDSDFIGTGLVTGLSIGMFIPLDNIWVLENLDEADATLDYSLAGGNVFLDYIYTPVPEASSFAWICGIGALATALFKRRRVS